MNGNMWMSREWDDKFMKAAEEKYDGLQRFFVEKGSAAVAFSGGVDSTLLLKAAHDAIGDKAFAVTALSGVFPKRERGEAEEFCKKEGCRQYILSFDELEIEGFAGNPPDRCYRCKKALFTAMKKLALEKGAACLAEGSNTDDNNDYRPGLKAIAELGIESPLQRAGLNKKEIRYLLKKMEIPVWEKPSFACLASRFVYGEAITREKLAMVEAGEEYLYQKGFRQFRVRIHGSLARIELLSEDISRLLEEPLREDIRRQFLSIGFTYVALDMGGYEMGSMNRGI